jgi:hypothetical protein
MKLYEILSKLSPNIQKSTKPITTRWEQHGPRPVKQLPQLGTNGGQSTAYIHQPSGKVVKVSLLYTGEQDPIYQFVRMCLKHQDNPHFPKIYSVKQYPDDFNGMRLIITMEQLYSMDWSDVTTYLTMLGIDPTEWGSFDREYLSGYVRDQLEKPDVRHKIYKMTTDPSLKQAMKLLEPLFRNYSADMHFGNVMVRRTSSGSQLVFMDPVTYG